MPSDGERTPTPIISRDGTRANGRREPALGILQTDPTAQFSHRMLDPQLRLATVLEMAERAYEEYQEACVVADSFGAGDMPDGTDHADLLEKREDQRLMVRRAYNKWFELTAQARALENDIRRKVLERPLAGKWREEFEELRAELRREYDGLGPHYDLLCDNTASVSVRMRQMEESGRDYESSEYIDLAKLYLSLTNQLQKYTEAMKSESINKQTQEVALSLVAIFERHFGTAFPVQWQSAVKEVTALVQGAAAA